MKILPYPNSKFKKVLSVLTFYFGFIISASAQINPVIPSWVKAEDFDKEANIASKQVVDAYYYLLLDEQVNTLEKISFAHYVGQALSEKGTATASQIEITYDPSYQKAEIHYIRVYRNGAMNDRTHTALVRVLDEEAQRAEGILSGKKTLYCNLKDIRKGDIVEYAYSIKGEKSIFGKHYSEKFYFGYNTPVAKIHRRIIVDKNRPASLLNQNFAYKPEVESGQFLSYTWRAYNSDIVKVETQCPGWYDPYPKVEISSFESWHAVKKWFAELFKPGNYQKQALNEIADSIKVRYPASKAEQITAAVDFVQKEIRYSGNEHGIYSHTPHTPDYVIENRYGDCKDKSLLLVELLKALKVEAWPALVHTSFKDKIESQLYSLYNFDHCITAISYDNYLSFVDATNNNQSGRFTKREVGNYGKAMVLDTLKQSFAKVPEPLNKLWAKESFVINDAGDATLKVIFRYAGIGADDLRGQFAANTLNEIQEAYRKEYASYSDNVSVLDSIKITDLKDKNEFITEEHYLLKNFWSKAGSKEGLISRSFIPSYLNRRITYADDESRKDPLALNHPTWINYEIKVNKEGGWDIPNKTFTLNSNFFYYKYDVAIDGELLKLTYQYTSRKEDVLPNQFPTYKRESDLVSANIILNTQQQLNQTEQRFNWTLLIVIMASLICAAIVCVQLSKKNLNYGFQQQYDSIGGWLILIAIGIIFTPLSLAYQFFNDWGSEFDFDYYAVFFSKDSALYEPLRGYFVLSVVVLNVFLFVFSCLIIHEFFKLRNTFRLYYIIFKSYNLFLLVYDLTATYLLFSKNYDDLRVTVEAEKGSILRIIIQGCIWIPYLWLSDRSKHTFTNGPNSDDTAFDQVVVLKTNDDDAYSSEQNRRTC